ncbi:ABC transporter permease [Reyranella sp.]|uniref:ABC transporter permease n=1 Tax=Reyranella sp. TaxID=1929291 RepID=UPI003BAC3B26
MTLPRALRPLAPLGTIVLFLAGISLVWQGVMQVFAVKTYFMPYPGPTWLAILKQWPVIWKNLSSTLLEGLVGLAISVVMASAVAGLCVNWRSFRRAAMPFAIAVRSIPIVAIAPLITLVAGRGFATAVIVVVLATFFPFFVNAMRGFQDTRPTMLELAHVYGASRWQTFYLIRFVFALPHLFSGLRTAAPLAILGAMLAEWLTGSAGIGYLILDSAATRDLELLWASILVSTILAMLVFWLTAAAEKMLLARTT